MHAGMNASMVTIITPTYDRRPQIVARAIRSVRAQTFGDFEMIVCTDGPANPAMLTLIDRVGDPRIRYMSTGARLGGYGAAVREHVMRQGLEGRYLCFLDDDNVLFPRYIERMTTALREQSAARFAICSIFHGGPMAAGADASPFYLPGELKVGHIDSLQVMVEREAMEAVGWQDLDQYDADGRTFLALGHRYEHVRVHECLGAHI